MGEGERGGGEGDREGCTPRRASQSCGWGGLSEGEGGGERGREREGERRSEKEREGARGMDKE